MDRRTRPGADEMRVKLLRLERRFDRRFLDSDPVGIVRGFEDPADQEIVGLLAAGLAYGRVESIRASLTRILAIVGPSPRRFVESFDVRRDGKRLDGFVHRFTRGSDVALFLGLLRGAIERSGSLQAFFVEGDPDPAAPTLEGAMNAFGRRLFALGTGRAAPDHAAQALAGARWLLPVPENGSVCKRHCLYLRWMIRRDDGIDLGAWPQVSAARLVVPLDVHMQRVASAFRWTRRRSPTWAMALEVTKALRAVDPDDPARYDFALTRLGILGLVRSRGDRAELRRFIEVLDDAESEGCNVPVRG